jgi:hypothetical protein
MGGLQAPVKCVCVRSQSTLGLRMADQVPRHAACSGHAHTRTRTNTGMCTCVVVCGHGMRACANRAWTGHCRFRYARLPRHAQGTPVPWETRAHRKRSMPARKTSTTTTVVVHDSCGIALSSATALLCARACTDMRR